MVATVLVHAGTNWASRHNERGADPPLRDKQFRLCKLDLQSSMTGLERPCASEVKFYTTEGRALIFIRMQNELGQQKVSNQRVKTNIQKMCTSPK